MRLYYVYIMASLQRALYIGITSDLGKRVGEHKTLVYPNSFTGRYNITRLVHVEEFSEVEQAIAREKELKGWRREKKIRLIQQDNPDWADLSCRTPR
jgi:putative endonuclease